MEEEFQTQPRAAIPFPVSFEADPIVSVGGIMQAKSLAQVMREEKDEAMRENNTPYVANLASYIKKCWDLAREAKEQKIEPEMLESLRQRSGEYSPDMLARLREQGSAIVYMMITSNKCRAAGAWLREALAGMPWRAAPTPVSDIDDATKEEIVAHCTGLIEQVMQMGIFPSKAEVKQYMLSMRDQAFAKMQEAAKGRADRMTEKMKDQMLEGGFAEAMDDFIEDLVTFQAAFLKGPVVRKRPQLRWYPQEGTSNFDIGVDEAFRLEWERVDPFNIYPAPDSTGVDDGFLIERHRLSRADLAALRDVEGYSNEAINAVLDDFGETGRIERISIDSERINAERRPSQANDNPSKLIEALQFWGSVQGKMLIEWGLGEDEVEDPLAEYHIEAWLVGDWVIKAMINPDPLHRKPYYKASWEPIPGNFWGRSIPNLCEDAQRVCNAAARALVNNMSLASGPQVAYNVSRLPKGEALTQMHPWKIWQFVDDGYNGGTSTQPISFFQPESNAAELMGIYEKFATLADEYTGIPRYMTGDANVGGAGRTASGMSMLMGNAGKTIKNVVATVDRILKPAIERLYMYNMMYLDDPELKGDVNILVEGANSLLREQQQQQRLLEFMNLVGSNPVLTQMIQPEGMAYMLRQIAESLGMDTDQIIPTVPVLKARMVQEQMQQALMQQQAMAQQAMGQPDAGGSKAALDNNMDQRRLMDGSPQVNTQSQV